MDARPHAVYRLLYSLQVIDKLMESHAGSSEVRCLLSFSLNFLYSFDCFQTHVTGTLMYCLQEQEAARVQWCKDFLYNGGFRHIFKVFTSM